MIQSNKILWTRTVYEYEENKKIESTYEADGSLNMRFIQVLDKSGNIIQDSSIFNGKLESTTIYTYETLDAKENWTIQKSFNKTVRKGKSRLKPSTITYRKIRYYE